MDKIKELAQINSLLLETNQLKISSLWTGLTITLYAFLMSMTNSKWYL